MDKSKTNLSQKALEAIQNAIIYGRLDFGEPLSEVAVAASLGMSKAPVRSALSSLKQIGLVEVIPKSGWYVINPRPDDVAQLLDLRTILEIQSLRLALPINKEALLKDLSLISDQMQDAFDQHDWALCHLKDAEYHYTFVKHSNNKYLKKSYDNIAPLMTAVLFRFIRTQAEQNKSYGDHKIILDLISNNKMSIVESTLTKHIERTKETYKQQTWSQGRATRKEYSFRNYAAVFKT